MATLYLIPTVLHEDGLKTIPAYVVDAIRECQVFFVENERTTRRYFKRLWKEMVIDDYEWHRVDEKAPAILREKIKEGKTIGIVSEAGCPAVADPGQLLVKTAQEMEVDVRPLTGPNSILLALMASGMNGQQFRFLGYLPIDEKERSKAIHDVETESSRKNCTQVFIETPYRNNQLIESILKSCAATTRLCIAVDLTGEKEWIRTRTVASWKKNKPDIHKHPAIFLLYAGTD